jgi:hypothetical protein
MCSGIDNRLTAPVYTLTTLLLFFWPSLNRLESHKPFGIGVLRSDEDFLARFLLE